MLNLFQETGLTSLKDGWVIGSGESKGEVLESRVRFGLHVKVLLPAIMLVK